MSLNTPGLVLTRIAGQTSEQPIAVFRHPKPGFLYAVPANTVRTRELVDAGDPNLIGVFDASHIGKIEGTIRHESTLGVRTGGWIADL